MGVPGLTKFIQNNSEKYFENYQLKDSLVIIDGSGFTNFLYRQYENQTSAFGGDYDIIANVYKDVINMFIRYNVTPIFVFDGAYEQRKVENIKQRIIQRTEIYSKPIKTCECMPYFGSYILFGILNDMDIPHISCDFEADSEIVVLAKLFDCPIMSGDSDFYLNTIPFIPLYKVTFDLKSSEGVINCHVYKVEKLLEEFGLFNVDYLPLVAALLGNDYIRPDTFASLLRLNPGTFNCGLKLKRITDWLKTQKNVKNAMYNMTNHLPRRFYVLKQIKHIIRDYKTINSNYLTDILQYRRMSKYQDRFKNHLKTNKKGLLPNWLENHYRKGIVSSTVMTILTLKKIFFKACIENIDKPPCYEVSINILGRIFGLLFESNETIIGIGRKNGCIIHEFKIKTFIHKPYVPLNDLNKADLEYRKNIILNLVGITNLNGFPKEWELLILILIYWAINTNNCKTSNMHALIVNSIIFNIITKSETKLPDEIYTVSDVSNLTDKSIVEQNIFNDVKKEDCLKSKSILSKYSQISQYDDKNLYYKIIHPYAQFQSCVYNFLILNSLLNFPYEQCRIENVFKGSFLYNLTVEMENHDPEMFISNELFKESDSLNKIYKLLINSLDELLSTPKRKTASTSLISQPKPKKTRPQ